MMENINYFSFNLVSYFEKKRHFLKKSHFAYFQIDFSTTCKVSDFIKIARFVRQYSFDNVYAEIIKNVD